MDVDSNAPDYRFECQFVDAKIKSICWQNSNTSCFTNEFSTNDASKSSSHFSTGSWDNGAENEVAVWRVEKVLSTLDETIEDRQQTYSRLVKCTSFLTYSDVSDVQYLTCDKILYSTNDGDITLLQYDVSSECRLKRLNRWNKVHKGCCTAFTVVGQDIVSVGEDGRIMTCDLTRKDSKHIPAMGDKKSAQFFCIDDYGTKQVVAGNSVGQIILCDLRAADKANGAVTLPATQNCGAVTALRCRPGARHLLMAGGQSGDVSFWDVRRADAPTAVLAAHCGPVWAARFHPFYANHAFTASNDGCLIRWDLGDVQKPANTLENKDVWLVSESTQKKLKLENLLPDNTFPVNSLDIGSDFLIACTDNEALWLFEDLTFS